jgi:hypothetical protein
MSATLGVATMAYLPFCFFNLINVLVSFIYAIVGFQIKRLAPEKEIQEMPEEATWRDIGGRRVEPTEHEAAVRGS